MSTQVELLSATELFQGYLKSETQSTPSHKKKKKKVGKEPTPSVTNSISLLWEVVQLEGRNTDLHTSTLPLLKAPHHPWDRVTTGGHLEAKCSSTTGPSGPHCSFVPQWEPLLLQSPTNLPPQRQFNLCRPWVNFMWIYDKIHALKASQCWLLLSFTCLQKVQSGTSYSERGHCSMMAPIWMGVSVVLNWFEKGTLCVSFCKFLS